MKYYPSNKPFDSGAHLDHDLDPGNFLMEFLPCRIEAIVRILRDQLLWQLLAVIIILEVCQ